MAGLSISKLWQWLGCGMSSTCEHSHGAGGSRPLPSASQSAPYIHQHRCRSHQASPLPTTWEHSTAACFGNCMRQRCNFSCHFSKKRWRLAVVSQKTHCNNVGKSQITPQISWQCCCHNWVDSYLHHGDRWVNLRRQRNVDLILVSVDAGRTKETWNSADCFTRQLT